VYIAASAVDRAPCSGDERINRVRGGLLVPPRDAHDFLVQDHRILIPASCLRRRHPLLVIAGHTLARTIGRSVGASGWGDHGRSLELHLFIYLLRRRLGMTAANSFFFTECGVIASHVAKRTRVLSVEQVSYGACLPIRQQAPNFHLEATSFPGVERQGGKS